MKIFARALLFILALLLLHDVHAQTPDPSTLPLVQQADLVIVGAFKVSDDFNYGGQAMAFNPAGSLFLSNSHWVGEVTIPTPVNGAIADMARAVMVQPMIDIFGTHAGDVGPSPADSLGGLLVSAGRLYCNGFLFYDANNSQERSHFSHSLTTTDAASFIGWSQVGVAKQSGFVAGPMTPIPADQQARLGGNTITGQCCLSIISRTSYGPSAFVMDARKIGEPMVSAQMLLGYPSDHATLGAWNDSNPTYGGTTQIGGMVIVPGTRSLLYFGSNGQGKFCYGEGTGDKSLDGLPAPGGEKYCYDPLSSDKGQHAYPYNYQVWAYDLNDLAAVKAGTRQPWDVKPYGVWPLAIPLPQTQRRVSAVTIDPASKRIYISQFKGEPYPGGGGGPLIWSIDVKAGSVQPPGTPDPKIAELEAQLAAIAAERGQVRVVARAALAKIATIKQKPALYVMNALTAAAQ